MRCDLLPTEATCHLLLPRRPRCMLWRCVQAGSHCMPWPSPSEGISALHLADTQFCRLLSWIMLRVLRNQQAAPPQSAPAPKLLAMLQRQMAAPLNR